MSEIDLCPCGSGKEYFQCCQLYHDGLMNPSKAEQLMRARYTAYVKKKRDFILDTWDEKSRPKFLSFEKDLKWQNLEIISTRLGAEFDEEGWVEFKAYFKQNKKKKQMTLKRQELLFFKQNKKKK